MLMLLLLLLWVPSQQYLPQLQPAHTHQVEVNLQPGSRCSNTNTSSSSSSMHSAPHRHHTICWLPPNHTG
jgi:hypothetical protein